MSDIREHREFRRLPWPMTGSGFCLWFDEKGNGPDLCWGKDGQPGATEWKVHAAITYPSDERVGVSFQNRGGPYMDIESAAALAKAILAAVDECRRWQTAPPPEPADG